MAKKKKDKKKSIKKSQKLQGKKSKKEKESKKLKKAKQAKAEKSSKKESKRKVDISAVFTTLRQLMNLIDELEVAPLEYENVCIYHAEVNALNTIKDNPEYNLTQLAENLNISKSALLKTTNKLTHKKLISKTKSPQSRQVTFSLTELGEKIAQIAPEWKIRAQKPILDALEGMNNKELAYFNDALERIQVNLENVKE